MICKDEKTIKRDGKAEPNISLDSIQWEEKAL